MKKLSITLLILATFFVIVTPAMVKTASAATTEWISTVRGYWDTASNWHNGVPAAGDHAYLAMSDAMVDYRGTSTTMPLALVSIDNRLSLYQSAFTSLHTHDLVVGDSDPADPQNPGNRSAYHLNYGATLVVDHVMTIGMAGTGMFDHWGGSATVDGTLSLGQWSTGRGEYYLFNIDTLLTVSADEIIGENGMGYFKLDGGTNTVGDTLILSAETGSRGTYDLERGSLHTTMTVVSARGQEGVFNQSGGSHGVTDNLEIGLESGSVGIYNMTGGTLTAHDLHIGENGTGRFVQDYPGDMTAGNVNIASELFLGRNNNGTKAYGYYQLLDGTLHVGWAERIGVAGDAEFYQSGGTNSTQELIIAELSGSTGKYTMVGGTLEAGPLDGGSIIIGNGGDGTFDLAGGDVLTGNMDVGIFGQGRFIQRSGTNTVYNNLVVSREFGSTGAYELYSGTLTTGQTHVSASGTMGAFHQFGGIHTTDNLFLGNNPESAGIYNLHSGELNVKNDELIGANGMASFNQINGTHTTGGQVVVGRYSTYDLSGGSFNIGGDLTNNGMFWMTSGVLDVRYNVINNDFFHVSVNRGLGVLQADKFINNNYLEGSGTIDASVENNGIISPGNSPGVLTINGDLTLGTDSILQFQLGGITQGTEYDYLYVTGNAALGGLLEVYLYDLGPGNGSFDPNVGDIFMILFAGGGFGGTHFSSYVLPDLADGKKWFVDYDNSNVMLRVNAVPVPSAILLLALGILGLAGLCRYRSDQNL